MMTDGRTGQTWTTPSERASARAPFSCNARQDDGLQPRPPSDARTEADTPLRRADDGCLAMPLQSPPPPRIIVMAQHNHQASRASLGQKAPWSMSWYQDN